MNLLGIDTVYDPLKVLMRFNLLTQLYSTVTKLRYVEHHYYSIDMDGSSYDVSKNLRVLVKL